MMPFLKAMLQSGTPVEEEQRKPNGTTECADCGGASSNIVAKAGMEEGKDMSKPQNGNVEAKVTADNQGTTTVAMRGPLGTMLTEALNKKYARTQVHGDIVTGLEGLQDLDKTRVSANGQVLDDPTPQSLHAARTRVMTGILPPIDDQNSVTCMNAILQAMGAVRSVDFIFVNDSPLGKNLTQAEGSNTPVKAIPFNSGNTPQVNAVAIESVEVIVRLKQS